MAKVKRVKVSQTEIEALRKLAAERAIEKPKPKPKKVVKKTTPPAEPPVTPPAEPPVTPPAEPPIYKPPIKKTIEEIKTDEFANRHLVDTGKKVEGVAIKASQHYSVNAILQEQKKEK